MFLAYIINFDTNFLSQLLSDPYFCFIIQICATLVAFLTRTYQLSFCSGFLKLLFVQIKVLSSSAHKKFTIFWKLQLHCLLDCCFCFFVARFVRVSLSCIDHEEVIWRYRVIFLTGSALKVLIVGVGKIPTKKVKVRVSHRENMKS